jgi:hypothetical protein
MNSKRVISAGDPGGPARAAEPRWTFLTNHAHVLLCLSGDRDLRVRDVAARVGITERAAQRILHDLGAAGYLSPTKVGRRNSYRLRLDRPMRHPLEADHAVRDLIGALARVGPAATPSATRRAPR